MATKLIIQGKEIAQSDLSRSFASWTETSSSGLAFLLWASLYIKETFVDRSRFAGTCYKAANRICVGQTQGYAKKDNQFSYHGQVKDVYVYPLVNEASVSEVIPSAEEID